MPLPVPVIELIAQDVLATLAGVTVENGFNYTLSAQRHSKAGDKRAHLSAVIVQEDPVEEPLKVYNTLEWRLVFSIGVFVIPSETDATAIDTYCNLIRSDVEKAMMVDRYRGGNALDTLIRAPRTGVEEGLEYDCIAIQVEVNYRTAETDPTVNAK